MPFLGRGRDDTSVKLTARRQLSQAIAIRGGGDKLRLTPDRPSGAESLQASDRPAGTSRTIEGNDDMTDFSAESTRTIDQHAVGDDPTTNAGSQCQVNDVVDILRASERGLTQCSAIAIILQGDPAVGQRMESGHQRHIPPTRQVWRKQDGAFPWIERTRRRDPYRDVIIGSTSDQIDHCGDTLDHSLGALFSRRCNRFPTCHRAIHVDKRAANVGSAQIDRNYLTWHIRTPEL